MKHKQRWAGAICCFVLFIVVYLFLATHMKGAFRAAGHPEIGLLFFILPGAVRSFFSQRRKVPETSVWRNAGGTLFDAHYAAVFFTDALILARAGMVIKCGVLVCAGGTVFLFYQ
ncbi:inner membrane protein YbjM [Escherichia coli]|uniref:Inner membrane protein YbjM n=1 Tax=Escherichia coli TaxID=562 RepID=A0A377AXA8_ECOLX|nr:inner membrane protein YbjM [Escherichia coli]